MNIIGIVGQKQHGKDTVCNLIAEALPGRKVMRFAFADALKLEVAAACGVPLSQINEEKARFRMGLQWWGTEFRRGQDKEYWIKQAHESLTVAKATGVEFAVVTDCRFENEAALLRSLGGILVRVKRPGFQCGGDKHASETEQERISVDWTIENSRDLAHLAGEVEYFLSVAFPKEVSRGS